MTLNGYNNIVRARSEARNLAIYDSLLCAIYGNNSVATLSGYIDCAALECRVAIVSIILVPRVDSSRALEPLNIEDCTLARNEVLRWESIGQGLAVSIGQHQVECEVTLTEVEDSGIAIEVEREFLTRKAL